MIAVERCAIFLLDENRGEIWSRILTAQNEEIRFARGELSYHPVEVELGPFFADMVLILQAELEHQGVKFTFGIADAGRVTLDPDRLKRALFNLTNNAVEVLEPGGHVHLFREGLEDGILIRVCDDGPGVPEAMRARIFEPFVTSGKKSGTGLGLAIVREIVLAHGGRIEVEESPLGGAAFAITLPCQK